MARMLSDGSCFFIRSFWECGACGVQGEEYSDSTDGEVWAEIEHTCEVDD